MNSPQPDAAPAADRDALYRPIFIGRAAELQQLRSTYDRVVQGRPGVVVLAGEPGIGKTALCTQLARYVSDRAGRTLWGFCAEADSVSQAYLPIIQGLDAYASSVDPDQLLADLGASATDIARIVPRIREQLGVQIAPSSDPEEDRWQLFQAVTGLLRNAAKRQPLVLVLEDLHEADRGTLDLLIHIARQSGDARLLVLATYRDVEVDRTHPLSATLAELRRFPYFLRIGLRGLSVAEVHRFYREVRGWDVPLSRAETVHQQTEGNPLFVQEVLRYLVEVGLVVRRDGGYVPTDVSLIEAEVPEGLRDIVGKRLSHLSERTNEVLHIASVIGQEFRLGVLQRVAGLSEEVVFEALEEAHARAIIDEAGGFGTSLRFRFTHAFFRQTLYDEIFAPRRIRWHRLIGSVLEEVYSDRLDEHAGELATHYAHSSDPADLARALTYDQLAAEQATRVYAYGAAARHLDRALQIESVLEVRAPVIRCELLLGMGEAMLAMEQSPGTVAGVAAEAFDLANANDDGQRAARAAILALDALSRPWHPVSLLDTPEVREWMARVDRFAAPNSIERVYAEIWVGTLAVVTRRPEAITAPLLRAMDLATRLGDARAYAAAAGFALTHVLELAQAEAMHVRAAEFMSASHAQMRIADLAHALSAAGRCLLSAGDRDGAERAWDELDRLAAQSREPTTRLQAVPNAAIRALLNGDLETAAGHLDTDARFVETIGLEGVASPFFLLASIRAMDYLGRATDSLLEEFPRDYRPHIAMRAFVRALLGRCTEALALRARFSGIEDADDATALMFLTLLLEVSVRCREPSTAEALLVRMARLANGLDGACLVSYGRLLGDAARLLDRPAQARAFYGQALEVCQRVRFRPELALVHLLLAELLLNSYPSDRAETLAHLQEATAEFELMGMQPGLARARELKALLGPASLGRAERPPALELPDATDPLTEREREVAMLLAQGHSNRQIATTLVISESTAEVHVKHILSKLGLRSRAQVAAWSAQRGDAP
ncbi:MAG TPA: AAA family ATPase [Chloroflexota bacterium]